MNETTDTLTTEAETPRYVVETREGDVEGPVYIVDREVPRKAPWGHDIFGVAAQAAAALNSGDDIDLLWISDPSRSEASA